MKILGYSERGVINSLFYEMKFSQHHLELLSDFLSKISFPYRELKFKLIDAMVMIEQSFSDFGDADLVLLLNNNGNNQVIFIEAKVKTFLKQKWTIKNEFEKFQEGIRQNKVSSSNLFTQLYYKQRLSQVIQRDDGLSRLKNGIKFPKCFSKENRKIGDNDVVLKAVNLLAPYCEDALFVALVPDSASNLESFYKKDLIDYVPEGFPEWTIQNWGYLSWERVEPFCRDKNLEGTFKIFKFNEGHIY